MIVVDIETSGKYATGNYGIWQIAAMEYENPKNVFFEEARINEEDEIDEEALMVTGKTEKELRDKNKQGQKEMIEHFLKWAEKCKDRMIAGQNVFFDLMFLQNKCLKYRLIEKLEEILGHRIIDLHTLAQIRFFEKNKKFKTEEGKSKMNSSAVLEMCGMKDERIQIKEGKIVKEGKPHNALEDVKWTAECFKKLLEELR